MARFARWYSNILLSVLPSESVDLLFSFPKGYFICPPSIRGLRRFYNGAEPFDLEEASAVFKALVEQESGTDIKKGIPQTESQKKAAEALGKRWQALPPELSALVIEEGLSCQLVRVVVQKVDGYFKLISTHRASALVRGLPGHFKLFRGSEKNAAYYDVIITQPQRRGRDWKVMQPTGQLWLNRDDFLIMNGLRHLYLANYNLRIPKIKNLVVEIRFFVAGNSSIAKRVAWIKTAFPDMTHLWVLDHVTAGKIPYYDFLRTGLPLDMVRNTEVGVGSREFRMIKDAFLAAETADTTTTTPATTVAADAGKGVKVDVGTQVARKAIKLEFVEFEFSLGQILTAIWEAENK